ncbi:Hypothetical predicted protein [Marmota monax]|uniref:Ig-like domain-containing protein n=1 Tax=Marmota monax TaxID=9995 RepID=A0A5E4CAV5_MARMO|nr:Hypothetical predicted protein [Marmota monax]
MCSGSAPAVKPKAWLSSGPSPEPGHVPLVCHVSGFYPKPVWVMWMRGEQEQQGTQRGDILPNADGTWNLRATLDVAAGEAAGLACRVKHSSLGGQDLVLYWGEEGLGPSWRWREGVPQHRGWAWEGWGKEEEGRGRGGGQRGEGGRSIPIGLVILAIIVPTLIFLLGLALWFWRRR